MRRRPRRASEHLPAAAAAGFLLLGALACFSDLNAWHWFLALALLGEPSTAVLLAGGGLLLLCVASLAAYLLGRAASRVARRPR